jgi:hypothetical protein
MNMPEASSIIPNVYIDLGHILERVSAMIQRGFQWITLYKTWTPQAVVK